MCIAIILIFKLLFILLVLSVFHHLFVTDTDFKKHVHCHNLDF
nr:MAG TPA: hypothetical protein [Caudoviricetes sp.]